MFPLFRTATVGGLASPGLPLASRDKHHALTPTIEQTAANFLIGHRELTQTSGGIAASTSGRSLMAYKPRFRISVCLRMLSM